MTALRKAQLPGLNTARRLVVRLHVSRIYGIALESPPG